LIPPREMDVGLIIEVITYLGAFAYTPK
jgi:hypothetical protein